MLSKLQYAGRVSYEIRNRPRSPWSIFYTLFFKKHLFYHANLLEWKNSEYLLKYYESHSRVRTKITLPTMLPPIADISLSSKRFSGYLNAYGPYCSSFLLSEFLQALRSLIQKSVSLSSILLLAPIASSKLPRPHFVCNKEKTPNAFEFFVQAVLPV